MIFISFLLSPIIFITHISLCNFYYKSEKKIFFMFLSFIFYILIFTILIIYLDYFEFGLDFFSSLSFIIFLCLGYMEFFSMICRGFSLRILTDIFKSTDVNHKNIIFKYADNRGIRWLFEKRIQSLEKLNLINLQNNNIYSMSLKGVFVAYVFLFFKKIFLFSKSGE